MSKKTLLFDLDGTLINTLRDLRSAVNYSMREHGFPERSLAEIQSFVGNGVAKLVARSLPSDEEANPEYEDCLKMFSEYYSEHYLDETEPYDGITTLLAKLKKHGFNLVVISNKLADVTLNMINTLFPDTFDDVEGDRKGQPVKPAPDMINRALANLHVDIKDCIVIGDSGVDSEMASNVGCPVILVTWGFRDKEYLETLSPLEVVDTPKELYKAIIKWSKHE